MLYGPGRDEEGRQSVWPSTMHRKYSLCMLSEVSIVGPVSTLESWVLFFCLYTHRFTFDVVYGRCDALLMFYRSCDSSD